MAKLTDKQIAACQKLGMSEKEMLDKIVEMGLLQKVKMGHSNYYINTKLMNLFINHNVLSEDQAESIESVHE
jgi:hypothetical protein